MAAPRFAVSGCSRCVPAGVGLPLGEPSGVRLPAVADRTVELDELFSHDEQPFSLWSAPVSSPGAGVVVRSPSISARPVWPRGQCGPVDLTRGGYEVDALQRLILPGRTDADGAVVEEVTEQGPVVSRVGDLIEVTASTVVVKTPEDRMIRWSVTMTCSVRHARNR